MIVVADSGPLHYLILLDQTTLLHHFYGEVLVPHPVAHVPLVLNRLAATNFYVDERPAHQHLQGLAAEVITDSASVCPSSSTRGLT